MKIDLSNYTNIEFVGDLHGSFNEFASSIENIEDTAFILTGDLNLGKQDFEDDLEMLISNENKLADNNNYVLIIRGNHDNPKYFKKKSTFRNLLKDDAPHIILVPDYSVIVTAEHTILCIGGARSVDRVNRIKDYNWWQGENIRAHTNDFYEKLEEDNIKVDIIVSHTAPLFAQPLEFSNELKHYNSYLINSFALYDKTVKNDVYKERLLLKGIYEKLNVKNHIKYFIYGHYHKSIETVYNKTKCISLGLKEIKKI